MGIDAPGNAQYQLKNFTHVIHQRLHPDIHRTGVVLTYAFADIANRTGQCLLRSSILTLGNAFWIFRRCIRECAENLQITGPNAPLFLHEVDDFPSK
jgi:hypothetical protein